MTTNNTYGAPQSDVHDPADPELPPELASRGSRLLAAMVDSLIVMCIAVPLYWLGIVPFFTGKSGISAMVALAQASSGTKFGCSLVMYLITLVAFLLINGKLLKKSGQTLGKRLLHIAIVRTNGSVAGMDQVLRRYIFMYGIGLLPVFGTLIGLADVLSIFLADRLCLHDRLADTKVVMRR